MNKKARLLVGLAICIIGLVGEPVLEIIKNFDFNNNNNNVVVVVDDAPSEDLKTLVNPIIELDISSDDADLIACFYSELSDIVANDKEFVDSTKKFRDFNITTGKLYFANRLKNKYESLGEQIDDVIVQTIGKESVSIDDDKRQKLVDALNAVAWSVHQ